jgi:AcrR family transcriptional regulator
MGVIPERKRGRPSDEQLRARRREDILAKAAEVFAQRGYPSTDMQALASAVGIAKGTLYLYFDSKEALFLAAVDQGMNALQQFIDQAIAAIDDPLQRIVVAIGAYLRFFKEHPEQVELLVQERAEFRDRKRPSYFEHRDRRRSVWHELLRGLIAAGRFRDVPVQRIDDVLCDLVYGTMFTNHFTGRHKPLADQVEDIIDIAFYGLLSSEERSRWTNSRRGES